jgi:hypothetical protein
MKTLASIIAALGSTGAMALMVSPAYAAACAPHDEFSRHLEMNYQEKSDGIGVANDGSLFEIFTSDKGTWSLLITNGRKISCIVAAGDMWVGNPALGPEASMRKLAPRYR